MTYRRKIKQKKSTGSSAAGGQSPKKDYFQFRTGEHLISMVRRENIVGVRQLIDDHEILDDPNSPRCRIYVSYGEQKYEFDSVEEYDKLRSRLFGDFFSGV